VMKTLRDPEVLRFFLLSSHYRGPITYSSVQLAQADETLLGLYRALKDAGESGAADVRWLDRFRGAMDDDFNTPEALAAMQGVARELNLAKSAGNSAKTADAAATLRAMGGVLGLLRQDPDTYLKRGAGDKTMSDAEIEGLVAARQAARAAKNFTESDRLREQLTAAGILLEDKVGAATQWRRA
jgi:cysteinyl-tRNA synthetase